MVIADSFGPAEGKKLDSGIIGDSDLCTQPEQNTQDPNHNMLYLYGDPACLLKPQILGLFKGTLVVLIQQKWNQAMSEVRIIAEWIFGNIITYLQFLDFRKGLKLQLIAIAIVTCMLQSAMLQNAHILYHMETKDQDILDFSQ